MITIKNLNFSYNGKNILKNINLDFTPGIVAILGKNGSGKTTLLKCLAQLLKYHGEIFYTGINLKSLSFKKLAKILSYLPADISSTYDYSVRELLEMGMYPTENLTEQMFGQILEMFDLNNFLNRSINTLSSGERQLVFLAQVFVQNTPVTLLDEPTNHLDIWGKNKFFQILKQIHSQKPEKIFIFTTHHIEDVLSCTDSLVFLHHKTVKFQGKLPDVFNPEHLKDFHKYNEEIQKTLQSLLEGGDAG